MTGDAGWNRIKTLFQAAVELAPDDRSAFLDQACGGDRTLQREVESLLAAHREAGDFAERPAIGTLTESRADGHYQILSLLGAGGMGEVYRARDAVLGRDVAIKILPPIFAIDQERRARFDREAHLLASLNHPNICAIYGIADINDMPGLVLELVEGATLKEKLESAGASGRPTRRGMKTSPRARPPGLRLKEALTIGRDIAGALEAAHERSIVHRDLKPANVKITPDGVVKVLDFGLAKASAESATRLDRDQALGTIPTESQDGLVIGTAAYMSPEQARGEPTDKRTDIWSFGCVLYEMLTGCRAAQGKTVSETIAAVLESEPDWTVLPPTVSPNVQRLLRRCLEKDGRRRLKDMGDARLELEDAVIVASDTTASGRAGAQAPTSGHAWRWLLAAALLLGIGAFLGWLREPPRASSLEPRRVSAELGTDAALVRFQYGQESAVVLSPDGLVLAFVAQPAEGAPRQIYRRRLDELRAAPLASTDGAINPFFSPDGRWIAFFADGKLKKVPTAGGGVVTICTVLNNRGGAWGEDGRIVFSPDRVEASLWHVSDSGGEPAPLIPLREGETTQRWPQILRGGRAVLFTANSRPDGFQEANVVVQEVPNGARKVLVRGAYYGRYLASGHLAYVNDGKLFAARFDIDRLELTGPSAPVLEGAAANMPVGAAEIAFSDAGTVAYLPMSDRLDYLAAELDWMDRSGKTRPLRTTPVRWLNPRFASDGRRLAFDLFDGTQQDVWIYEWARDALTRLTFDPAADNASVWTPDARRIVFRSTRGDGRIGNLYWQRVDGVGEAQRLTRSNRMQTPRSWHSNERLLAFSEIDPHTGVPSIMMLQLDGDEVSGWHPTQPTVFQKGADSPMFSPDGRWLAYVAKRPSSAGTDVFVRPFPGPGGPWQISTGGGTDPVWSLKKPELFYGTPQHQIMVTSYATSGGSFRAEKPRLLSDARFAPRVVGPSFDVHPDGDRFALARAVVDTSASLNHVTLIFNFFDELRRILP
jgi:Tol biopolymer transport system component/tRNA A-37 threonylcarbamoyl transferase component Bud32